ncbi:hypothetical protein MXB_2018 [Myxobolus squamalis]|nr:hypothetical protein MXB_2018 [Myxobolus squamalis]
MSSGKIWDMRKDYDPAFPFIDFEKITDPLEAFKDWFELAKKNDDSWEPNSMIISTVNQDGIPSSRVVLLKQYNEEGFQFFTNYNSQKAKEIVHILCSIY